MFNHIIITHTFIVNTDRKYIVNKCIFHLLKKYKYKKTIYLSNGQTYSIFFFMFITFIIDFNVKKLYIGCVLI